MARWSHGAEAMHRESRLHIGSKEIEIRRDNIRNCTVCDSITGTCVDNCTLFWVCFWLSLSVPGNAILHLLASSLISFSKRSAYDYIYTEFHYIFCKINFKLGQKHFFSKFDHSLFPFSAFPWEQCSGEANLSSFHFNVVPWARDAAQWKNMCVACIKL